MENPFSSHHSGTTPEKQKMLEQNTMYRYRNSLIVIAVLVVVMVAWFFFYTLRTQPLIDQALSEQFSWKLTEVSDDPTAPGPHTVVGLKIADVTVPVGTYAGTCDDPTSLLAGELSSVLCEVEGGSGTEIGIFRENGDLVLKQAAIDPSTGRGKDFTPIVRK